MKERTVTVTLGSTELEVYAGNMALVRYRRSGGSMARLEKIDKVLPSGESREEQATALAKLMQLGTDELIDGSEVATEFLHANLVDSDMTLDDLINCSETLYEPVAAYIASAIAIPWLFGVEESTAPGAGDSPDSEPGELVEEDATDSSKTGPSPSSSSAGTLTSSGKSALESGVT